MLQWAGKCGPLPCDRAALVKRVGEKLSILFHILAPKGLRIAKIRFLSWSDIISLMAFLILFLNVGPFGWELYNSKQPSLEEIQ